MIFQFRAFRFPVNPQRLEIGEGPRVQTHALAQTGYLLLPAAGAPAVIRGSGVFTGGGAADDFRRLRAEYLSGGSGVLILGAYGSLDAVFRTLTCTGRQGDSVGYDFEFVEFPVTRTQASGVTHTARAGETLWEIARRYGVPVERLMALNPHLRTPGDLSPGQEVFVC